MSEFRIAKLEALLARVLERRNEPRSVVPVTAPSAAAAAATLEPHSMHVAATTPPPPPVAVPAVSIPRQPVPGAVTSVPEAGLEELQESTHVSRSSGPALVPSAAESHARVATAARAPEADLHAPDREEERAPVSSERTVDPSLEADPDSAEAPPASTRQLATNPPPHAGSPRSSTRPPSLAPESAPRSVGNPVITRGSLPPDANAAVEYRGALPVRGPSRVGDLLDATLLL